jgi:hypothetical protein
MSITSLRGSTLPNKSFRAGRAKTKNVVTIAPDTATTFANGASISAGGGGGGSSVTISNVSVTDSGYIVSNATPYIDSAGGYIKITGTGFATGCTVYVSGTPATSTTFISSTEVRAQVGAAASNAQSVYVVNTDSSVAILLNAITYSGTPSWSTAESLGTQISDIAFNIPLSATSDSSIVYTLASGSSTPSGTTLFSNGVFAGTVTGITNDTNYSFTVVATDIENQLSARAFTVSVSSGDAYFNTTALLLNGEANVWIRDSSTNNFAHTIAGDTKPTAFSPYNYNWSAYFDGTNDYLTCTTNTTFGASDFTVECWVYMPSITNTYSSAIIGTTNYNGIDRGWALDIVGSSGYPRFYLYNSSGTGVTLTSSTLLPANRWTHLAAVRSGTTVTIYMNGVSIASGTNATNDNFSAPIYFGTIATSFALGVSGYSYTGYISNARVVVGVAVYTGAFTPPTTTLGNTQSSGTNISAITGTSTALLTLQDNRFKDNSSNAFAITRTGDTAIKSFGPFIETDTTTGSGYFDSSGDYIAATIGAIGSGNFTIEFWSYQPAAAARMYYFMTGSTPEWGDSNGVQLLEYDGYLALNVGGTSSITIAPALPRNQWQHVAIVRNSGVTTTYVNGVAAATTLSNSANLTGTLYRIGVGPTNSGGWFAYYGYMTDFRIVTGTAVYTANFTPTTTSLTSIENTKLLTLQYRRGENNHRFVDEAGFKHLLNRAGQVSQGSFSPFSPAGWSAYFNGTTYLNVVSNAAFAFGTGDFTLEAWIFLPVYPSAGTVAGQIISAHNWNGSGFDFGFRVNTAGPLYFEATGGANVTSTIVVPLGQWNHVACVRNSGTVTFYINGLSRGSASITTNIPSTTAISLGHSLTGGTYGALTGYISNARVVKGVPVYTGNFTPQTTSLTSTQSSGTNIAAITSTSTSLLTLQDNRFKDNSTYAFTLTNGSSSLQAFSPFRPSAAYTPSLHGGSAYFDGTGDYITTVSTTSTILPSATINTFTIDGWLYPTALGALSWIVGDLQATGGSNNVSVDISSSNYIELYWYDGASKRATSTTAVVLNQWNYFAIVVNNNAITIYVNSTTAGQGGTTTLTTRSLGTSGWAMGAWNSASYYTGYMSSIRWTNGVARTISSIPTAPHSLDANTSVLMNFTQGGVVDAGARHVFETLGDAKISNVASKFGIGSLYFDGTSDGLYEPYNPLYAFGTGDFTIEFWINFTSKTGYQTIMSFGYTTPVTGGWIIQTGNGDGNLIFYFMNAGTATVIATESGSTVNNGTWYHVMIIKTGGNTRIYRNGTQVATGADTRNYSPTGAAFYIGGGSHVSFSDYFFNGYIDDLRITRGARTVTVPTSAHLTK